MKRILNEHSTLVFPPISVRTAMSVVKSVMTAAERSPRKPKAYIGSASGRVTLM